MQVNPSHTAAFELDKKKMLVALTTSIREGVVFSVERKEECRITASFSLKNPNLAIKRTGFSKRVIDSRSIVPPILLFSMPETSILQRTREANSKVSKFLNRHFEQVDADEHMTLTIVFVMGKISSLALMFEVRFKGELDG